MESDSRSIKLNNWTGRSRLTHRDIYIYRCMYIILEVLFSVFISVKQQD